VKSLAALLALLLVLGLAACGGGGGDDDAGDDAATPAAEEPAAGDDEGGEGRQVFASSCGGCHTLEAAGTSGTVGPPLDGHDLDREEIEEQVREGGGAMPAFEGTLSDEEIEAVSDFVAQHGSG